MVKPINPSTPVQSELNFGDNSEKQQRGKSGPSPFDEVLDREKDAREKARNKAAENEEFKDKRVKASPLVVESELARMKEILSKSKGGGGGVPKLNRDITKNYKAGGRVSSASKRADGCVIRGKTKGRMV